MYVNSFLERIGCRGCGGCFRDKDGSGFGGCLRFVKPNAVAPSAASCDQERVALEKKQTHRKIEIMPVELVSCTNNKLVSSSKCLNLDN